VKLSLNGSDPYPTVAVLPVRTIKIELRLVFGKPAFPSAFAMSVVVGEADIQWTGIAMTLSLMSKLNLRVFFLCAITAISSFHDPMEAAQARTR
jgi:hypothetical protein